MMQQIEELKKDALFVINHSGGKDSQAMYLYLKNELGVDDDQIVVIHAILPGADWDGTEEHIANTIDDLHGFTLCKANKTFDEMVRSRFLKRPEVPSFPAPKNRQCTSDLKRDPISKEIRRLSKELDRKLIINCIGIRAEESANRSRMEPWKLNKRLSAAGRTVYDWFPIFEWKESSVFLYIKLNGQEPFWTYGEGMKRKSCVICIMACESDIKIAARLRPDRVAEIAALEEETGYTIFHGGSLKELIEK